MLKAATQKDPSDQAAWLSLVRLAFLDEGAEAALELLDDAKQKAGDSFGLRSAQITYAVQLPKEQAKELLATLATGLDKFNEDEQDRLRRVLGIAYYRLDDWRSSAGDVDQGRRKEAERSAGAVHTVRHCRARRGRRQDRPQRRDHQAPLR